MLKRRKDPNYDTQLELPVQPPPAPEFLKLLRQPLVSQPLPSNFRAEDEAAYLAELWNQLPALWDYDFEAFVHAGGSGMVFRVRRQATDTVQALKVARRRLATREGLPEGAADSLSPVSGRELHALEKLSHPNVVRLFDAMGNERGVVAIATTYVDNPQPLDAYLRKTLARTPRGGVHAFSPIRLDGACTFLLDRFLEIAQAIAHMHGEGVFHFDVKPANVLISAKQVAILTDLGACVHSADLQSNTPVRVNFTWTYAHPHLTTMIHQPASISGGGLKASAELMVREAIQKYDLFAFGRTLQEALAILESEFGERAYAAYGFRYLHLIACLLLDGHNAPSAEGIRVEIRDGRRFVSDTALEYPVALFAEHRIKTAAELVERLKRYSREYSWHAQIPELDPWQPKLVNTGVGDPAPFSDRVAKILGHPAMRRLKSEAQLGWIREVFPGATHNRWSHTIGVFAAVVRYFNSLLADPEVPTLRVLLDPEDLSHAMVAALLHDIGQVSFGHDLEAACPHLFDHEAIVERLLEEKGWNGPSLHEVILAEWSQVEIQRVLNILRKRSSYRPIDGVAEDVIGGPIDADKLDYLQRDSIGCGVAYGRGIDALRFLQALSVDVRTRAKRCRVALAYKAKGSAAIEAVLLARYQMFSAVYWHHTFRCIQAMFSHAAAVTFGPLGVGRRKLRESYVNADIIRELLYHWVVCGKSIVATENALKLKRWAVPREIYEEPPLSLAGERTLELVWKFADDPVRHLLERLSHRDLYKRVLEIKVSDLGEMGDYSALRGDLMPDKRPDLANRIETGLIDAIHKAMVQRGPPESETEEKARERHQELLKREVPRVVIDFPTRGVPDEVNFPPELGNPARKYTGARMTTAPRGKIFYIVRDLQAQRATLRIFAAAELHELIVRYLDPGVVEACVAEAVPRIRIQE